MPVIPIYLLFIGIALSLFVGFLFGIKHERERTKPFGTIHVETSDPDGPYIFLELDKTHSPDKLLCEKEVTFLVDVENYVSPQD